MERVDGVRFISADAAEHDEAVHLLVLLGEGVILSVAFKLIVGPKKGLSGSLGQ